MAKKTFKVRGLEKKYEQDLTRIARDTRSFGEKVADLFKKPIVLGWTFIGIALLVVIKPWLLIPAVLTWLLMMFLFWHDASHQSLPLRLPKVIMLDMRWLKMDYIPVVGKLLYILIGKHLYERAITDWNDPKPGWNGYNKARGDFFWGNERGTRKEIWMSGDDLLTHMLIFGTTGAGKTESLLSLGFNTLSIGSGMFYADAKGTSKLALQVFSMARFVGRDDDFLLINYSTGNRKIEPRTPERLSNTANPFTHGAHSFLADILISLAISETGGENAVFTDGAIQLMNALMSGLVEMRDQGRINLSIRTIREFVDFQKCIDIANDSELSEKSREAMQDYLNKIPGYIDGKDASEQDEKTLQQFGYNQFYFRRALSMLTDTYGHIYDSLMGEVDFKDVVFNRRIMVVTLPALEKSPPELQQLGKVILAAIRSAMSLGIGSKYEGTKEEIVDALPSSSEKPTIYILDEYGYMAVDGFAVTAAQARGLGCSVIFAGQDYAGFKRGSEREAEQVVANTKFKSIMALEDGQATWELIRSLAGEGILSEVEGFRADEIDGFISNPSARVSRQSRIDLFDLRQQIEGDFHLFFKDGIVRGSMFHAGPSLSAGMQIHRMVEVEKPDAHLLSRKYGAVKRVATLFEHLHIYRGTLPIDDNAGNRNESGTNAPINTAPVNTANAPAGNHGNEANKVSSLETVNGFDIAHHHLEKISVELANKQGTAFEKLGEYNLFSEIIDSHGNLNVNEALKGMAHILSGLAKPDEESEEGKKQGEKESIEVTAPAQPAQSSPEQSPAQQTDRQSGQQSGQDVSSAASGSATSALAGKLMETVQAEAATETTETADETEQTADKKNAEASSQESLENQDGYTENISSTLSEATGKLFNKVMGTMPAIGGEDDEKEKIETIENIKQIAERAHQSYPEKPLPDASTEAKMKAKHILDDVFDELWEEK